MNKYKDKGVSLFDRVAIEDIVKPEGKKGKPLKEELEDEILIAHHYALGDYYFGEKKVKSGKGELVYRKASGSLNLSKVVDGVTRLMQSTFKSEFVYSEIRAQAVDNLQTFFEKYELTHKDISDCPTKGEKEKKKEFVKIKTEEEIRSIVKKALQDRNKVSVPIDKFFEVMNIGSLYRNNNLRVSAAISTIEEMQNKAQVQVKTKFLEEVEGKLVKRKKLSSIQMLPVISFVLDDESEFNSIKELKESKSHNKAKHIKYIEIEFETGIFSDVAVPLMNYIVAHPSVRRGYKTTYSHTFDIWMRSLYRIQEYKNINHYRFDDLKEKWGLSYSKYSELKRDVLLPVMKDFNTNKDIQVKLIEVFKGKSLDYVYFVITKMDEVGSIPMTLSKYIALRHSKMDFFKTLNMEMEEYAEEIATYTDNIEKYRSTRYSEDCGEDKTFAEWEDDYMKASECFEKLERALNIDKKWFDDRNLKISNEKLCLVNKETDEIFTILGGKIVLDTPQMAYANYIETGGKVL